MKSLFIVLIAITTLIPHHSIFAEEAVSAQPAPTRQNIIRERLAKQKENYLQSLQEARMISEQFRNAENQEERQLLRQKARQGFIVRLGSAIERLSEMQNRVETRIETAETEGFDVTSAQAFLETSKTELNIVLDIQDEIKVLLTEMEDGDGSETTRAEIRTKFEAMKTHFKNARMNLVDSLQSLRKTIQEDKTNETEVEILESENESNS